MKNIHIYEAPLFHGMNTEEIRKCIVSLRSRTEKFRKGEYILESGNVTSLMGILLSGSAIVEFSDFLGNRTVLNKIQKFQPLGEAYALLQGEPLMVDIIAQEDTYILFFETAGLLKDMDSLEPYKYKLALNLLSMSLKRNLMLSKRSFCIAGHSLRDKISSYLNIVSKEKGAREFDIPFNREELADYLNADRSALSYELSKMKKEGLIDYHKFHFKLIK